MADITDMSLNDIIQFNRSSYRGDVKTSRRGIHHSSRNLREAVGIQKGQNCKGIKRLYTRKDINSTWKQDLFEGYGRKAIATRSVVESNFNHTKLVISNLDSTVLDSDIQNIFAQFGPLRKTTVHYSQSGQSLGTAAVIFVSMPDAVNAMKQYNGVPLNGRALIVELVISNVSFSDHGRLSVQKNSSHFGNRSQIRGGSRNKKASLFGNCNQGQRRRLGGNNSIGRKLKNKKAAVRTVEELNAELDAYNKEKD